MPLIALVLLTSATLDFRTAWPAKLGHGTHGVFIADVEHCQWSETGRTCSWDGTFIPDSALDLRYATLAGGIHITHVGQHVPALDTGARGVVYPIGGNAWLYDTVVFVSSLALLITWIAVVPLQALRRRREASHRSRNRT